MTRPPACMRWISTWPRGSVRLREGDAFAVEASAAAQACRNMTGAQITARFTSEQTMRRFALEKERFHRYGAARHRVRTVRLSTDIGSLELHGISCTEKAEISVDMGSIELEGSLAGSIRVDCGMGSAELRIPGRKITVTASSAAWAALSWAGAASAALAQIRLKTQTRPRCSTWNAAWALLRLFSPDAASCTGVCGFALTR